MSRVVPPCYPAVGKSAIADRIRARRGERGLLPLDGALLHVPPFADAYNSLLGATRNQGKLPADIRELIILRVAARNQAYFEWIQHEPIGRASGLSTAQLRQIRDTSSLPDSHSTILTELQKAVLAFADLNTKNVKVPTPVTNALKKELKVLSNKTEITFDSSLSDQDKLDALFVECATVTATYNLVSRILISTDVGGLSDDTVPWPAETKEWSIQTSENPPHIAHCVTHQVDPACPWIFLVNSLLTDISMWKHLLPHLLASPTPFNVLLHSSRGHGKSTTPSTTTTIPLLAKDIASIMDHIGITKAHAVLGVSQGGATAMSFGAHFPERVEYIVACDTSARTAPGNKEVWDERIALARSSGIQALASITVPRWFPSGSPCFRGDVSDAGELYNRGKWIEDMICQISVDGFACGAAALQDCDLIDGTKPQNDGKSLLDTRVKTLLVAGSLDGGGKIALGLQNLGKMWNEHLGIEKQQDAMVEFAVVPDAGHLPMVDRPAEFWSIVSGFLGHR